MSRNIKRRMNIVVKNTKLWQISSTIWTVKLDAVSNDMNSHAKESASKLKNNQVEVYRLLDDLSVELTTKEITTILIPVLWKK